MNYHDIKQEAKERRCSVEDLLPMSRNSDPFYTGYEGVTRRKAEWFRDVWQQHGSRNGVHLRRLHYWFMSLPGKDIDGEVYLNDEKHWTMMNEGGVFAREKNLVPAGAFIDRRNPPVQDYTDYSYAGGPSYEVDKLSYYLPDFNFSIYDPSASVSGYGYSTMDQHYHLEVWAEKSTMDDVLIPICREYDAVYKTFAGGASLTAVVEAIQRQRATGKPSRIFYISDFDLAGYRMPREVARKVEFWKQEFEPDLNMCIEPIALTPAQIDEYHLPRTPVPPIKEGAAEARKKARKTETEEFEAIHGHGVTELDALEALHPGVLSRIVVGYLSQYRDNEMESDLYDCGGEAQENIDEAINTIMDEYTDEIGEIREKIIEIMSVTHGVQEQLVPFRERLKEIQTETNERIFDMDMDLPQRPYMRDPMEGEEPEYMFKTGRDYCDQLEYYDKHKNGKAWGSDE